MRTSVDIPNALLAKAQTVAQKRGTTLKRLVEEGLRRVLEEAPQEFRLADASFQGDGLVEGLAEGDWERLRDLAYEGRGA
ncbi:MAG: hypothetical protein ACKVPX_03550 [Myxococcaceae bacterium]